MLYVDVWRQLCVSGYVKEMFTLYDHKGCYKSIVEQGMLPCQSPEYVEKEMRLIRQ